MRVLTQLRQFGISFNPVSFYYCFDPSGERVEAVAAEVTNTPWRERHTYVLERRGEGPVLSERLAKEFHVSPFLGMNGNYEWRVSEPGDALQVHIENHEDGRPVFDATLSLTRRELEPKLLRRLLVRYPAASLAVVIRIYLQAAATEAEGTSATTRIRSAPGEPRARDRAERPAARARRPARGGGAGGQAARVRPWRRRAACARGGSRPARLAQVPDWQPRHGRGLYRRAGGTATTWSR